MVDIPTDADHIAGTESGKGTRLSVQGLIADLQSPVARIFAPTLPLAGARRARIALCLGFFAILIGWLLIWPYTGNADAVAHLLRARAGLANPAELMDSWSRWGSKLILLIPAQYGVIPARIAAAAVTIALLWQTMRLADDLKISRPILAGPLLLLQPLVFQLASDTMTEIPMALGLVIALRLWLSRRFALSCLAISMLPTVRPEGFFFCALWGILILFNRQISWKNKSLAAPLLAAGVILWLIGCRVFTGDWFFFIHCWSWPLNSYPGYGRGPIYFYLIRWPLYLGPPLSVLFLLGLRRSLQKSMALPWAMWGLVFILHTILYWRGWFASCGELRILACVAPFAALVCLHGWNAAADWLMRRNFSLRARQSLAVAALAAVALTPAIYYIETPSNYYCFPLARCCQFVQSRGLLQEAPALVLGDPVAQSMLDLPPHQANLQENSFKPAEECRILQSQPLGSIGIWDDQLAKSWYGIAVEDLPGLGYTVLYQTTQPFRAHWAKFLGLPDSEQLQTCVVIRKDRPGRLPAFQIQ